MIEVSVLRIIESENNLSTINNENNLEYVNVVYENGIYKLDDSTESYKEIIKKNPKMIKISIKTPIKNVVNHLIYRLQKEKLNPIETALIFKELVQITEKRQSDLIKELNKTQGDVSNKIRLLKLPNFVQLDIINGRLTERHGRALLQLSATEYNDDLKKVYQEIMNKKLKVKETEIIINKILGKELPDKDEKLKKLKSKRELKNKTAILGINQINNDLSKSLKLIEKYYPELLIEKTDGLLNKDYQINITIKNVK